MKLLITALLALALTGCTGLLETKEAQKKVAAFSVDAGASYCKAVGKDIAKMLEARALVRAEVEPELIAEDMEACLGCPGDAQTFCTGKDRPKVR